VLFLTKEGYKSIKIKIIHKLWKQELDFIEDIIFDSLTEQEAFILESNLIKEYGRLDLGTGCLANMTDGGEGCSGLIHSDKTKQLWFKQRTGVPAWNKGLKNPYIISEETRQKLIDSLKGRVVSEETREKIKNSLLGHSVSEETRQKISEVQKGVSKPHKGYVCSNETRLRRSQTLKNMELWNRGKKLGSLSQEVKDKLSKSHMGRISGMKGKKHSLETIENMKTAWQKRKEKIKWQQELQPQM
jgi:hypothetical protein